MIKGSEVRGVEQGVERLFVDRWSPRAMSGEEVTDSELMTLFEAARWAPSAGNHQPWRYLVGRAGSTSYDAILDALAERLKPAPQIELIQIEGHTDNRGPDARNLSLSQRRAESVMKYLLDEGIDQRFAEPLDVHRRTGRKVFEAAAHASRTARVLAPPHNFFFVTPQRARQIRIDQIDCMGCLSACRFSNWSQGPEGTTGKKADPRSFCIQKTLKDIAHELGFAELSPFYRAFQRWTGSTPAQWRHAHT